MFDAHSHFSRPLADKVRRMEAAGIERALLVVATGNPETAYDLESYAREGALTRRHIGWDGSDPLIPSAFAEMMEALPPYADRFLPLAPAIFTDTPRLAEEWVGRALQQGCIGFGEAMIPAGGGRALEPMLAAMNARGGAILLASSYPPATEADLRILGQLASKYPSNVVILGHMGGSHTVAVCEIARANSNVYVDMSTHPNILAGDLCVREIPGKLLFGTNDPYCDIEGEKRRLHRLVRDPMLRQEIVGPRLDRLICHIKSRISTCTAIKPVGNAS